ncbi:hypothetical protein CRUP_012296, partial [Coryphaenoides rupestris]
TPEEYNLMWILTDVSSTFFITAIFIFHCDVWSISSVTVGPDPHSSPTSPTTPHLPTITEE